ncbi:hypothetical protein ISF9_053 [Microbacterium phage vB_MoxS-ISF9]|uniref:Uncharacterized protein n=1 Tax=Microbacterium phage vB_MoxS-ISF9 TaxID=1458670 RepID=W8NWM4_9CAUD|nr:hypothetical protein ISF9_053 [Microbacterium phage vB_MoxS-ISF9]AHL18523.1 hypothetical protein ISF9_053 [Microbacterium phage vB_MoxS-ISF9]
MSTQDLPPTNFQKDLSRGGTAWHMSVDELMTGHFLLGFNYPMSGDSVQRMKALAIARRSAL